MEELPMSEQENFERIYGILQQLVTGVEDVRNRVGALEAKDAITKPLWQEMRADQQRILERMERIETRMDGIETHLQQQDEKMGDEFRKIKDKFDLLLEDILAWRADVRDLKRRVTTLESVG
jgi:chromosome segregation ATPase